MWVEKGGQRTGELASSTIQATPSCNRCWLGALKRSVVGRLRRATWIVSSGSVFSYKEIQILIFGLYGRQEIKKITPSCCQPDFWCEHKFSS